MTFDPDQHKRELRLKIGRSRRLIDARLRTTASEGRKLASWQTYVTRYPGPAVLAAFGLGLCGATLFSPRGVLKNLGAAVLRGSVDRAATLAFREFNRRRQSAGEKP